MSDFFKLIPNLMHDFRDVRIGNGVRRVLLYFPNVKEYRVCNDYTIDHFSNFRFEKNGEVRSDCPTKWLELG
jgi:hypothetical protein